MWDVLGWIGVIAVFVALGWLVNRLLRKSQGGDRSYGNDDDTTRSDAINSA
jgi:hypothetical protein